MSYAPLCSDPTLIHPNLSSSTRSPNLFQNPNRPAKKRARNTRRPAGPAHPADYPIIVHCHLSWDWVWQRPQQFISRLSRRHKILFLEMAAPDPQLAAPLARFYQPEGLPNLTVLRLQFPAWRWNDADYVDRQRARLVNDFLENGPLAGQFDPAVHWFYDPMAFPGFASQLQDRTVVYDCMDELSKFRAAPPELVAREAELLKRADVVFTGGRKLFEAKSRLHANCHFFGCGVDWEHFGQAQAGETVVPPELAALKKPILGYFGVIDERLDYELIRRLAQSDPNWSIALIGPVLKVDEGSLPSAPNLHWLGQRPYAQLPALCKGFDVCLMPFARNESTEFINPTKALEYMATGRPIISTAIPDVVSNFGSVVSIARNPDEFIGLCRQAVGSPDAQATAAGLKLARENSWEAIVAQLEELVSEASGKEAKAKERA